MEEGDDISFGKLGLIACGFMVVVNLGIAVVVMVGAFTREAPDYPPPAARVHIQPEPDLVIPTEFLATGAADTMDLPTFEEPGASAANVDYANE